MTGSRARRLIREEMEKRYYRLGQFLGCFLLQDWPECYGTPENAVNAAISEYPIEFQQQVRHELATLLEETPDDADLRIKLNYGLGVGVHFKGPTEARTFAGIAEAKLMCSIKQHFEAVRGTETQ